MTKEKIVNRRIICRLIYSFIASFAFFVGKAFDTQDVVPLLSPSFIVKYLALALIIFVLLMVAWPIIKHCAKSLGDKEIIKNLKAPSLMVVFILPLICYIISLLSIFPGIFSYDCWQEWQMVETRAFTAHHPVLHVLIVGGLTKLSNDLFGSGNPGICIYVLLQILLLLFVLRKVFIYMKEKGVRAFNQWIALLFMAFSPMINLYNLVVSKDSMFAIFALLFFLELIKLWSEEDYFQRKGDLATFVVSALGTMIFRNNGLYVVLATLLLVLLFMKGRKKLIKPFILIAVIYIAYIGPFYKIHHVEAASKRELLSIPIQQLARINRFNYEDLSEEDLEIMHAVIEERFWDNYIPTCADAVKNGFIDEGFEAYKKEFIRVWINQGLRHPVAYINAFLANTVDFWYPLSSNDSYDWLYGKDLETGDFLDYRVAEPGSEVVIIKPLHDLYYYFATDLKVTTKVFPAMLLNPGFYLLLWIAVMFSDIIYKQKRRLWVHVALFLTFATVLLGPMVQVRYMVILYYAVPLWFLGMGNSNAKEL